MTRSRAIGLAIGLTLVLAVLYFVIPEAAGLEDTWRRLRDGDPAWLIAALAFEAGSYAGYLFAFRAAVSEYGVRLSWKRIWQITLAGVAATRVLATAGAGGVLLTTWALRRSQAQPRAVAGIVATLLVSIYAVFMIALVIGGLGLAVGLFPGPDTPGLTIVPAAFGGAVILAALVLALVPLHLHPNGWLGRLALAPAVLGEGVRGTLAIVRARDPRALGAVAWWAFDIAVLWACFRAFGAAPAIAVLVVGYFVGMLGNVLPLPGGIGGVEGGMIAAFVGFGIPAGLALVAVLSYRAIAFWLPTVPGAFAYLQLTRAFNGGHGARQPTDTGAELARMRIEGPATKVKGR